MSQEDTFRSAFEPTKRKEVISREDMSREDSPRNSFDCKINISIIKQRMLNYMVENKYMTYQF